MRKLTKNKTCYVLRTYKQSIVIGFFLVLIMQNNHLYGQTYYSKFDYETEQISSYGIQLNKLDNLYVLSSPGICDYKNSFSSCAELTTIDDSGKANWAKNFPWLKINKFSTIITDNEILVLGTTHPEYVSFSLVKLSHEGDSLETIIIPFEGHLRFNNRNFFKYGDQYIISGQTQYAGDSMFYAGLIWLNADFTVDTIMHFPGNSGSFERGFEDEDGNCQIFIIYYDRPAKDQYYGYKKFDRNKKEIHSWFDKTDDYYDLDGIILFDGTKYFVRTDGLREEIYKLSNKDEIQWKTRISGYNHTYNTSVFHICNNQDILICGYKEKYLFDKVRRVGSIIRLSSNGVIQWERGYGALNDEDDFRISNYLRSIAENEEGDLIMGGSIEGGIGIPLYQYIIAEADLWVLKTDSIGCISEDKCNDDNFIRYLPAELDFDQLTMRHKEWFTSVSMETGEDQHISYSFHEDTLIYDTEYGWSNFRKLMYKDEKNEVARLHNTMVRMDEYGKVYGMEKSSCTLCNSFLLYDFSLKAGDIFTLPFNFGTVMVTHVDSFILNNGFPRRRIILRHDNPDMQNKYGDLIWIEGIGSLNGLLYYEDWQKNTRTHTTCYFDRNILKYNHPMSIQCQISSTDESGTTGLILYPNPTSDQFSILSGEPIESIQVFDPFGTLVFKETLNLSQYTISTQDWTPGIYFVQINMKGKAKSEVRKVVVVH